MQTHLTCRCAIVFNLNVSVLYPQIKEMSDASTLSACVCSTHEQKKLEIGQLSVYMLLS